MSIKISIHYNAYYLKNVIGKETDYSVDQNDFDKIYTYKDVPKGVLYTSEHIESAMNKNKKQFEKEYECKYGQNIES